MNFSVIRGSLNRSERSRSSLSDAKIQDLTPTWTLFADREIRAYGNKNAWICQMGRRADDGDFESFVSRVTGSTVKYDPAGPGVTFESPRDGTVSVHWDRPTTIKGKEVKLPSDWRFNGPFAESKHMSGKYRFNYGGRTLELDFNR